jgi:predicted nucleic acid-binding protein
MSVLIDTTIWSLAFRRRKRDLNSNELALYYEWERLILDGEASLIGPIRQETLSGIASQREVEIVKARLIPVHEFPLPSDLFLLAADFFNLCRAHGISAGAVDMMICAAAHTNDASIFTADPDFPHYAKHLPITLHKI